MYYLQDSAVFAEAGTFMQTDPIGYGSGMNLQAYVLNDPVNFTDPLGLMPVQLDIIVKADPLPQNSYAAAHTMALNMIGLRRRP